MRGLVDFLEEVYRPIAEMDGWGPILFFPVLPFVPIMNGYGLGLTRRDLRVATFGPRADEGSEYPYIMMALVGISFGGIHCIAWAFAFPSHTEQLLWRISAMSVTTATLLIACALKFFSPLTSVQLVVVALIPLVLLYVFARFALLALPLMSLRSLPPGAYRTADWTRFIPHI